MAATSPTADDLELARKMIAAARGATATPKLQALLYEKASEFAVRDPGGGVLALQALAQLRLLRPTEAAAWDERALAAYDRLYTAGNPDERSLLANPYRSKLLQVAVVEATAPVLDAPESFDPGLALCRKASEVARLQGPEEVAEAAGVTALVAGRQRLARRAADLRAKVQTGQGDAGACQERAALLLAVLNQPVEAARCAALSPDPKLAYYVRLTAALPSKLSDEQAIELGDWYKAMADKLPGPAQPYLLRRAVVTYVRFLASRPAPGPVRTKVSAAANQIAKELDKKPVEPQGVQGARDRFFGPPVALSLLPRVGSETSPVAGAWARQQNELSTDATAGRALLALPVVPQGDYEICADFTSQGASAVGFALPVAATSLDAFRHDADCGIGMVQGAWKDFGARLPALAKDASRHTLYARVVNGGEQPGVVSVLLKVDGIQVGRWEGAAADLAPQPTFALPNPKVIGLCASGGRVAFSGVYLNMISGTAPRPEEASPTTSTDVPPDGSRPADAVVTPAGPAGSTPASVYHDLVTLTLDNSKGQRSVQMTLADPSTEFRVVRTGLASMVSSPANVAELRIGVAEYRRLGAMSQTAPRGYTDADLARLAALYHDYETALSDDARAAAEHQLFAALHRLGEQHRKATAAWVRQVRSGTSAAEFQLILKLGQP